MLALCCDNFLKTGCDKRYYLTTREVYRLLDGSFPKELGWTFSERERTDFCPSCSAGRDDRTTGRPRYDDDVP